MNKDEMLSLKDLFTDAAKEVLEKGRIKAQMNRILKIVEADKRRLQKVYAEIGQMYVDGTIEENQSRVQMLRGFIDHINDRIRRAKIRYSELEKAHSVDDCTTALKGELLEQFKNAKESTSDFAKDFSGKAKAKAQDLSGKVKIKASDLSDKAKKIIKKEKGVELTEEQNAELLTLIEEQIGEDEEIEAASAVEKIQDILNSLDIDDIPEEAVAEIAAEEVAESEDSAEEPKEAEENFDF